MQEQLPELHMHFQTQSFHTSMYASSWFLTIFLTSFPLPVATRIFDIFMCEVSLKGTLHTLHSAYLACVILYLFLSQNIYNADVKQFF